MDKINLVTSRIKNVKKTEYLIIFFSTDHQDIEILAHMEEMISSIGRRNRSTDLLLETEYIARGLL
jgi:hypothetical protein